MKECSRCRRLLPATPEYFYARKDTRDRLYSYCKGCHGQRTAAAKQRYREKHGHSRGRPRNAAQLAWERAWYRRNHEYVTTYRRAWRAAHKQELIEYNRARREQNAAEISAQRKAFYQANWQRLREESRNRTADRPGGSTPNVRRWRERHPLENREQAARRHAREKYGALATAVNFAVVLRRYDGQCGICGKAIRYPSELHFDHIVPLVLGGSHTEANLQPAHAICNLRKGTRLAENTGAGTTQQTSLIR